MSVIAEQSANLREDLPILGKTYIPVCSDHKNNVLTKTSPNPSEESRGILREIFPWAYWCICSLYLYRGRMKVISAPKYLDFK